MNRDFENIEVKSDAVRILEEQLKRKRKPCMINTGAMCDPYMHLEEELCGFGVAVADVVDDANAVAVANAVVVANVVDDAKAIADCICGDCGDEKD